MTDPKHKELMILAVRILGRLETLQVQRRAGNWDDYKGVNGTMQDDLEKLANLVIETL